MADENNIELSITADTKSAKKSLDDFEKSASKSISDVTSAFKILGAAAAAAVAFVAGREVIEFFSSSAEAAAKNEAEVAKLEASLKSLGEFTPEVVDEFKEFADQLESTSKFSDDAAIAQLAFAKQLGLTNDDAKNLVQTAADLASVTGDSLEGAVAELGRTLTGTAGALGRTIPEVKSFTEEQLKSGAAIELVSERLRGAAANAIKTYQGALIQLENAQDDFKKSIGSIITQNPILVETIKAVTEGFKQLETLVADNKEEIKEYVTTIVKLAVNAIPPLIESLGGMLTVIHAITKGLTALTAVTADTISGFLQFRAVQQIISSTVQSVQATIGALVKSLALLVEGLSKIPGASTAFEALGFSIEEVQGGLDATAAEFDKLSKEPIDFTDTIDGLNQIRDDAVKFGNTTDEVFEGAQKGIKAVAKIARDTANKISAADSDMAKSAKAASVAQEVAGQAAVKASVDASKAKIKGLEAEKEIAKEREKLADQAEAFIDRILSKESSGLKKIQIERERDLKKLDELQKAGLVTTQRAEELRTAIIEDAAQKQLDIRRKKLEDFKKDISEIASNPIKVFVDEIDIDTDALRGIGEAIAGGLGAVTTILKGKAGAEDFVKDVAGAFGDALIPGIGPIVSEITGVLAKGPEEVKKMIDEFTQALPEIIENIAKSVPVLAEGLIKAAPDIIKALTDALPVLIQELVDAMPELATALAEASPEIIVALTKAGPAISQALFEDLVLRGGAFKIGIAIVKGMVSSGAELGKEVLKGFSSGISQVGQQLGGAFAAPLGGILEPIGAKFAAVFSSAQREFIDVWNKFTEVTKPIVDAFKGAWEILRSIGQTFIDGINVIFSAIDNNVFKPFVAAVNKIFTAVYDNIFKPFIDGVNFIFSIIWENIFKPFIDGVDFIFSLIHDKIFRPFIDGVDFIFSLIYDNVFKPFIDAVDKLKGVKLSGGGSGDLVQGAINTTKKVLTGGLFASGGVVPAGFPNDSFPARLTSREMVLPPDIANGLTDLIRGGGSSKDDDSAVAMLTMLNRIANLLAQPQSVDSTVEVDGQALAKIILQLNRQNARLTA